MNNSDLDDFTFDATKLTIFYKDYFTKCETLEKFNFLKFIIKSKCKFTTEGDLDVKFYSEDSEIVVNFSKVKSEVEELRDEIEKIKIDLVGEIEKLRSEISELKKMPNIFNLLNSLGYKYVLLNDDKETNIDDDFITYKIGADYNPKILRLKININHLKITGIYSYSSNGSTFRLSKLYYSEYYIPCQIISINNKNYIIYKHLNYMLNVTD